MNLPLLQQHFDEIVAIDFEFKCPPGGLPQPVCVVAREWKSGREHLVWLYRAKVPTVPPFPVHDAVLFVGFYISAEIGCFLELGWPVPRHWVDLYAEFRNRMSGLGAPHGYNLPGALLASGLPLDGAFDKEAMRDMILKNETFDAAEQEQILDYCHSDVLGTARLFDVFSGALTRHAILRGGYGCAVASMERTGVPIDTAMHSMLCRHWGSAKNSILQEYPGVLKFYEGLRFRGDRFAIWVRGQDIDWPTLPSGRLALDDDTMKDMSHLDPVVRDLRDVKRCLSQLKLNKLQVGPDGRNRTLLAPYGSRTGRNQPSNTAFIFGLPSWLRGLIQPPPGYALAYLDWSQQEFGIAAALSEDQAMVEAYTRGDPYLGFAVLAEAAPEDATKQTHGEVRDVFKLVSLATQYGMGPHSLGCLLGAPVWEAKRLLELHRRTFPRFWSWTDGAYNWAALTGSIQSVFGWTLHIGAQTKANTIRNFPVQANGAEMMRIAAILMVEAGLAVCCPVHDAFLIQAPADEITHAVFLAQQCMRKASEIVLSGFPLRSDAKIVLRGQLFPGVGGNRMWHTISHILTKLEVAA